jgi:large subunit ribosomal protein L1
MAEVKKTKPIVKKSTITKVKAEIAVKPKKVIAKEIPDVVEAVVPVTAIAKAGKRSSKSIKAEEELKAKEIRKSQIIDKKDIDKPKFTPKPTRTRLERRGKKFRDVAKKIEDKLYTPTDAVELATQTSPTKFDATVELHINLNVDPKQADQNIRDNIILPAGTGKTVRIAAFTDEKVENCDVSGTDTIVNSLEKGIINYDILIATPATMPKLSKYARLLGPRGLMPNPKSGTVTADVQKAVSEAKAGRVEYRVDSTGIIHLGIGKVSFGKDKLFQNFQTVMASVKLNKPSSVRDIYIKSVYITTSMGPSIAINISDI